MIESLRPSPPDVLALFHEVLARMDRRTGLSDAGPALWPRFAAYYERLASLPRRARRSLQRRWRCSLAGLALLLALGQVPALAATITVDGTCSLIDAITAANDDVATSGCAAGGGADTIVLQPGSVHTLTAVDNGTPDDVPYVYGPNGLPLISSDITIEGNGSTIIREPEPDEVVNRYRILAVSSGGNLTVRETRISGGRAMQPNPQPQPPPPNPGVRNTGGGVFNAGTLSLSNSTVSDSSAQNRGGGIYNAQNATLILINSTISGNSARTDGGGVWIGAGATVSLMDSTVSGNSAGDDGGGFDNAGTLTVANSTLSGNSTTGGELYSYGGGVNNTGIFNIVNSTVSGNSASSLGGGVHNGGTMAIANSTVASNAAVNIGGGLFNRRDGVLTFTHTLVSGNTAQVGPEAYNALGAVTTRDFNLFGHDGVAGVFGFPLGPTDLLPNAALNGILIPQLLRLGGPTRTLALVAGSPAVDAIPVASCTETLDQRGAPRPQDGDGDTVADCDIGAFELMQMPVQAELVRDMFRCITPTKTCRVTIQCNLTEARCTNDIVVTVPRRPRRNSNGTVTQASSRIPFARSSVTNVPPGEAQEVILRLTRPGRRLAEGQRRLRGRLEIMEIAATVSNTPPLTISRTPVTIRLRRR